MAKRYYRRDEIEFQPHPTGKGSKKFVDRTGQRSGRLVAIGLASRRPIYWFAECDCGLIVKVQGNEMNGGTKSCGCLMKQQASERMRTHGLSKTPEYRVFHRMKWRCQNKDAHDYKWYGGRGIELRFATFEEFINEVGPRPAPGMQIDRINNNGHYEAGNVRWVPQIVNKRNMRCNKSISYQGHTKCLAEWVELLGIPYSRTRARLRRGWCAACSFENINGEVCHHKGTKSGN